MRVVDLFENRDSKKTDAMQQVIKDLGPLDKKIDRGWSGKESRLMDAVHSLGIMINVVAGTSEAEIQEIVDALNSNQLFKRYWIAEPMDKTAFGIEDLEEHHRRKAEDDKRKARPKNFNLKSISKEVATTRFSKEELEAAAKKTGEVLFRNHHSGLIWGGNTKIIKTNSLEFLKSVINDQGDDTEPTISTFEYVFFPSGKKKPIDGSDELNIIVDSKKLQDVDGNIYLCDNTDDTEIRIIKPVIDPKDYDAVMGTLI